MTRLAAVDCGTNSIRLLISEVGDGSGGGRREVLRMNQIVRLGEGVDATGQLDPQAIARTRTALDEYVNIMRTENVAAVRMVATSATRDAENRDEFFDMTSQLLGDISPGARAEVISGAEEAALSFRGAVADLDNSRGPYCVIDLGGGSTEFITGQDNDIIDAAVSVDIGCVRLTEKFLRTDPATDLEVAEAEEYVNTVLAQVPEKTGLSEAQSFVGVAGTFTTLSALAQGLESYDPTEIHGSTLGFDALQVITDQLILASSAERAANPVVHPRRADVLGGGAIVVNGIIDMIRKHSEHRSFIISEKDIMDGIIANLAEELH